MAFLEFENFEIVKAYPYPHSVVDKIMETGYCSDIENSDLDWCLNKMWDMVISKAKLQGIFIDNKMVFAIRSENLKFDGLLYIGSFDHNISLGFGVEKW